MLTIREYFYNNTMVAEEFESKIEEELALWEAIENEEIDLEVWAQEHDVDLEAIDEHTNETVLTLWGWDMCGD